MICAGRGATVAIVQREWDSFAGGACANPGFQYPYLILAAPVRADGVAVGDRLMGWLPASLRTPNTQLDSFS